ncbi:MAG TPA: hypothetical protein VLA79_20685 [Polyangia bacterium]|nr:hypothetical protein [Polyangia bacterium]
MRRAHSFIRPALSALLLAMSLSSSAGCYHTPRLVVVDPGHVPALNDKEWLIRPVHPNGCSAPTVTGGEP